jgi:hypothetical protein
LYSRAEQAVHKIYPCPPTGAPTRAVESRLLSNDESLTPTPGCAPTERASRMFFGRTKTLHC